MFGVRNSSTAMDVLNDDRLTPAQKSAYCYDHGICDKCGIKTHWIGPFKRRPYTNERVWNGICRFCRPGECPAYEPPANNNKKVFPNLAADELFAKATSALEEIQTGVTVGVKEGVVVMKGGINTLNDSIKKETEKMNRSMTSASSVRSSGSNNTQQARPLNLFGQTSSTQRQQQPSQQQQQQQRSQRSSQTTKPKMNIFGPKRDNAPPPPPTQPAFSNLKSKFQTNEEGKELLLQDESTAASSTTQVEDLDGSAVKGKLVKTPFGKGQVVDYRSEDDIYVIDLHHHENNNSSNTTQQQQQPPANNTKLFCKKESFSIEHENKSRQKKSMELNEAYESLEKMRRLNLEVECQERGVNVAVDFDMCTVCLLHPELSRTQQQQKSFPRIRQMMQNNQKVSASPCLFCAAPCCSDHANQAFRKEHITACEDCCKLFQSEYVVDCINQAHGVHAEKVVQHGDVMQERPLDHMMDLYDRVRLLLQYSSQYIESIAVALEANTKKYNNVNVGASSAGMVSGALGVAAAAAIFTPAGPPLLVASLLLGGGATTVQTGTEVVNYFSEPNKFADKIIALVGMLHSLLRVKENLREILTARLLEQEGNPEIDRLKKSLVKLKEKQREAAFKAGTTVASTAVLGGVAIAEVAAAGATIESAALMSSIETGVLAGRNANMISKSGTAIARGARFARFAGGALSAATLVLEARTMTTTIEQIKAGHPCEKADALRAILKELPTLPTTDQLDEECRIYIGAMSNRVNATSLEDAINLIESKAIQEWQLTKASTQGQSQEESANQYMAPAGASILEGDEDGKEGGDDNDELALLGSALREAQEQRSLAQSMSGLPPPTGPPLEIETASVSDSVSVLSAPPKMSQSLTQLPSSSDPASPATLSQSTLFERIQRFKQDDSVASSVHSSSAANNN
ncbi:expressed unknown protein [Seminavis robusta]|uniref:Uncharacterized protein n=1 Tax=Seminavis robusta TaxID=568900 RepID=A0A9N8HD48_9STRA|nr:expressed unknown protein [Seminavis robusta]|eukprot:Sro327_g118490.1 n/a (917) ;mRNA; f:69471-72221